MPRVLLHLGELHAGKVTAVGSNEGRTHRNGEMDIHSLWCFAAIRASDVSMVLKNKGNKYIFLSAFGLELSRLSEHIIREQKFLYKAGLDVSTDNTKLYFG